MVYVCFNSFQVTVLAGGLPKGLQMYLLRLLGYFTGQSKHPTKYQCNAMNFMVYTVYTICEIVLHAVSTRPGPCQLVCASILHAFMISIS